MYTAPPLAPTVLSLGAPTISRSPSIATDLPKPSPALSRSGAYSLACSTQCPPLAVPLHVYTYTTPRVEPSSSAPTTSVLPLIAETVPMCFVSSASGVTSLVCCVQVTTPSMVSVCSTRLLKCRSATLTVSIVRSAALLPVSTSKSDRPCTTTGSTPVKLKRLPPTFRPPARAVVLLGVQVPVATPSPAMRSVSPAVCGQPVNTTAAEPFDTPCSHCANSRSSPSEPLKVVT